METYHFDMTPEQTRLARWASKAVTRHLAGVRLSEGIKIGEALLVGRVAALKASGANTLRHKGYALAFQQWKQKFHFPDDATDEGAARFMTDAILIAQHRPLAERLIAMLPPLRKADMGVPGLAKLIVQNLEAQRGHVEAQQRLADMKARGVAQENPIAEEEKPFKPSVGPWESKRVRELREAYDDLTCENEALKRENAKLLDANVMLHKVVKPLLVRCDAPFKSKIVSAVEAWEKTWAPLVDAKPVVIDHD
jgi:hypothetical protein